MKKWLVTIAALWLAGCSSGEINKNYYQLPVVQSGTQSTASQGNTKHRQPGVIACYGLSRSLFLTIWRGMVWFIKPVM